jgi:hypothetical protein
MDYCRQVGNDPDKFYAAILAEGYAFARDQYSCIESNGGGRWLVVQ